MVKVTLKRDREGYIQSFEVTGHAAFAPHGEDIVCAAVSVLTQTAVLSLERIAGVSPEVIKREGYLSCNISPAGVRREKTVSVLLESMSLGLEETARSYPGHMIVEQK